MGQVDGGPGIPSYFELLRQLKGARGLPLEALRWWLTMRLEGVAHDPAHEAFEFLGGSVLVQSENQFINSGGQHVPTGAAEPVNRTFAENFTRGYGELANRDPVFAELRNVFDLALAAALCREEGLAERVGWDLGVFAPGGAYRPETVAAPRMVDSVVAYRTFAKGEVVVQAAGGVQLELRELLSRRVSRAGTPRPQAGRPEGRWWWNAQTP